MSWCGNGIFVNELHDRNRNRNDNISCSFQILDNEFDKQKKQNIILYLFLMSFIKYPKMMKIKLMLILL